MTVKVDVKGQASRNEGNLGEVGGAWSLLKSHDIIKAPWHTGAPQSVLKPAAMICFSIVIFTLPAYIFIFLYILYFSPPSSIF